MKKDELRNMISEVLEEKLLELIGDPDEGLVLRKSVHDRLVRQMKAVKAGERGEPIHSVMKRLKL